MEAYPKRKEPLLLTVKEEFLRLRPQGEADFKQAYTKSRTLHPYRTSRVQRVQHIIGIYDLWHRNDGKKTKVKEPFMKTLLTLLLVVTASIALKAQTFDFQPFDRGRPPTIYPGDGWNNDRYIERERKQQSDVKTLIIDGLSYDDRLYGGKYEDNEWKRANGFMRMTDTKVEIEIFTKNPEDNIYVRVIQAGKATSTKSGDLLEFKFPGKDGAGEACFFYMNVNKVNTRWQCEVRYEDCRFGFTGNFE